MASRITSDEAQFVVGVSRQTGIDPRVLIAWAQVEGAYAPSGTGGHNYLNLRPYPGDPYQSVSPGGFEQFGSVQAAVAATVRRLQQPFAQPIIRAAQAHATPGQEAAAIASTGWDAGHYGGAGGPSLQNALASIFGSSVLADRYQGPETAAGIVGAVGTGSAAGPESFGPPHIPLPHIPNPFESFKDFFEFITSWRFVEVLGGFLLLLVGIYLLGRQFGIDVPVVPPAARSGAAGISAQGQAILQEPAGVENTPPAERVRARRERIPSGPTPVYSTRARRRRAA